VFPNVGETELVFINANSSVADQGMALNVPAVAELAPTTLAEILLFSQLG
jgi:hypothetical protein